MCTLTFIPEDNGYDLAMNRDEQIKRGSAIPPARIALHGGTAIYPRDTEGGTWIAANDRGLALALLNWNDVGSSRSMKTRSRGAVIPFLICFRTYSEVQTGIQEFNFQGIWPFRLVGVFPVERSIGEWRWSQQRLEFQFHEWKPRHWFSSGLSDKQAESERGAVCRSAWSEPDAGSLPWLRRLHASHANGPGPFSLCVHRENVRTLSYTEVTCRPEKVQCIYSGGSPCLMQAFGDPVEMARVTTPLPGRRP